jgi:hypothetical protein
MLFLREIGSKNGANPAFKRDAYRRPLTLRKTAYGRYRFIH